MPKYRTWKELKNEGSEHYQCGNVQPIDLYREKGTFTPWALTEIAQHAIRNMGNVRQDFVRDMEKIIHYAELLIAEHLEQTT